MLVCVMFELAPIEYTLSPSKYVEVCVGCRWALLLVLSTHLATASPDTAGVLDAMLDSTP